MGTDNIPVEKVKSENVTVLYGYVYLTLTWDLGHVVEYVNLEVNIFVTQNLCETVKRSVPLRLYYKQVLL